MAWPLGIGRQDDPPPLETDTPYNEGIPEMDESRNPKNVAARGRVQVALLPAAGVIHGAHACMEGARKYGPYNWRDEKIALMAYASAALRHIQRFVDGEDVDADSGCHHLGHAIATCAIALDAMECDAAIDDRPRAGAASDVLRRLSKGELEQVAFGAAATWPPEVEPTPTELTAEANLRNKYGHTWEYLTQEDRVRLVDLECRRIRDEERECAALSAVERKAAAKERHNAAADFGKRTRQQTALDHAKQRFADGHKYVDDTAEALVRQARSQPSGDGCSCVEPRRYGSERTCGVCGKALFTKAA